MSNLLIDIGNSDVKVGYGNKDSLHVNFLKRFSYSKNNFEIDFENNLKKICSKNNFGKIGISVLKENNKTFLNKFFMQKPVYISKDLKLPVKIDYTSGIGNDRICSAAGAAEIYSNKNLLIIDFGTATTFTLVSDKVLKGGMISPGIKTSMLSLSEKTSLPAVELVFPKEFFGRNTIDNLRAGILFSSLYSAERIIKETKKKYARLFVIATGGYSKLISRRTKLINKVDQHLVLRGINIIVSQ
ncbi:MAG: type III pantothenate kinase [bacterium]